MEANNNQKQKYIDISKIAALVWEKRKTFVKVWVVTFILSCVWILPQPRYYTCEVKLAPELNGADVNENTNLQTGTIDKSNSTIGSNNRTETGTEDYTKTEEGKIGVMTYQEMQMKWRESFLNIDMQIIDELGDLFMKVW